MSSDASIDTIAPVALKVMGELDNIGDIESYSASKDIEKSAATFDPLQIFEAVYNGITLLNQQK